MTQSNWRIESVWKVESKLDKWIVEKHYDDYEGDELPIIPHSGAPLYCSCGSTEFRSCYKVWHYDIVNDHGDYIDSQDDGDSTGDTHYECAECGEEVPWRGR